MKLILVLANLFFLTNSVVALGVFRLIAPCEKLWTQSQRTVFTWNSSRGADNYEVWVDGSLLAKGVKGSSLIWHKTFSTGRHTWFVVAKTKSGILNSADTLSFNIGEPPKHPWEYTDGFEQGGLKNYISKGISITKNPILGKYAASFENDVKREIHYAINPAYSNNGEAETKLLFSLDDAKAKVGVGFADQNGVWCYAFIDRDKGKLTIDRKASYSIFSHTQSGYTINSWTETKAGGSYIWTSADTALAPLVQGVNYRLRFVMSNRLPSLGKAAMAILETERGEVLGVVRTFLDDVNTPHPLFLIKDGNARVDDFEFQLLDRWSLNWKPNIGAINPHFNAFNPAVWRDKNRKWWMVSRTDNRIRWSDDGINWSKDFAAAPPVEIMDPAIIGVQGNPWNDGLTYLASCNGCCEAPVEIFTTTDPKSGIWKKWGEHSGLSGCGREHAVIDTHDWPSLDSISFGGKRYRFLSINEGDKGRGGSTMLRLTNDQQNFTDVECEDLFGNSINKLKLMNNLWAIECLNLATSSAMGLDGDIRVMTFKDGYGRYEKAIPQEAILNGKEPWKVKALQTIPGFPNYWGNRKVNRDKNGASWYGGFCQWPSCFVWIEEEKKVYCYWGESDVICLSTATIEPQFTCASVSLNNSNLKKGQNFIVNANIWNYGDANGEKEVSLFIDGIKSHTKKVNLTSNTDQVISFTITPLAGTHVVSISVENNSEMVSLAVNVSEN